MASKTSKNKDCTKLNSECWGDWHPYTTSNPKINFTKQSASLVDSCQNYLIETHCYATSDGGIKCDTNTQCVDRNKYAQADLSK